MSPCARGLEMLLSALAAAALAAGLAACAAEDSGGFAADASDGGGDTQRDGDTMTDGDVADTGDVADAGDGADAGSCEPNPPVPTSDASVQTVSFAIVNDTDGDRFVADQGWYCTAFGLAQEGEGGFANVALALGFQCGCECPFPGPAGVSHYVRLAPGDSTTLRWGGRRLGTVRNTIDCEAEGWEGLGCINELAGYQRRAEAGVYRVSVPVAVEDALGADCTVGEEGADCFPTGGFEPGNLPNPEQMCPATATVEATFSLPAEGDVVVDLTIE